MDNQVTTDEIGRVVVDALSLVEKNDIDTKATTDDGEGISIAVVISDDPNNLKIMLSNDQIFTVRIIAGDR